MEIPAVLPPRIRTATMADLPVIQRLIKQLATYERAPEQARATADQLQRALFGDQPAVYALVAEGHAGEPVGFAVWYLSFSTWEGTHGIYLEDLFVSESERGGGLGRALLTALAMIARHNGYRRVEWAVLNWNAPAIGFYRALGATSQDEWTVNRLQGDALAALAGFPR